MVGMMWIVLEATNKTPKMWLGRYSDYILCLT